MDAQSREYIESIQRLAQRLSSLIDQLLHYSRLGSAPLSLAQVDLEVLLDEVIEDLRPLLNEMNAEVRRPHRLPILACDGLWVRDLLQNLVTNAVKYNDKAGRYVEIDFIQTDMSAAPASTLPVTLLVRDNGIGIPAQHLYDFSHLQATASTQCFRRRIRGRADHRQEDRGASWGTNLA